MSPFPTAIEIAAAVRSGRRHARVDVVDEHLARIADREGEIHAFNLVLAEPSAIAAAAAIDARSPPGRTPVRSPACRSP